VQPLICSAIEIRITYSEFVFIAFGIQRALRMRRIILSYVVCPAVQCFSTFSHIRHGLKKKKVLNIICFSSFCIIFVWHVFHSKKN